MLRGLTERILALSVDISALEQRDHCWMEVLLPVVQSHVLLVQLKHSPGTQAQEETEFIRLLWLEIVQGGFDDTVIDQEIAKVGGCLIIDAEGVFDAIHRSESAALSMQDKRSAVEGLALREGINWSYKNFIEMVSQ